VADRHGALLVGDVESAPANTDRVTVGIAQLKFHAGDRVDLNQFRFLSASLDQLFSQGFDADGLETQMLQNLLVRLRFLNQRQIKGSVRSTAPFASSIFELEDFLIKSREPSGIFSAITN
jgi:hypothetical protein